MFFIIIVFRSFKINKNTQPQLTEPKGKKHITLAVGILSKLTAHSRRDSIRFTWFKMCQRRPHEVVCKFFTDVPSEENEKIKNRTLEEERENQDMLFMPYRGMKKYPNTL